MSEEGREVRLENAIATANGLVAQLPLRRNLSLEEAYAELDRLIEKVRRERRRKGLKDDKDNSDSAGV